MTNIILSNNDFSAAAWSFDGADLTNTKLENSELSNVNFSGATLANTSFTDATVKGANFSSSGITEIQLESTKSYKDKDLSGIKLGSNNLENWDFNGQNLSGASFENVTFGGTDFTNADTTNANFSKTAGKGFTESQLQSTKSFADKNLSGINFSENDLSGWNFAGLNLSNVLFKNATLDGLDISAANLTNTTAGGLTKEQFYATKNYKDGDLSGIDFSQNDLSNWNFAGKDLSNSKFASAKLEDSEISGANLTNVAIKDQISSTKSYKDKNFAGTNFTNVDLSGVDLQGQDFTNAILASADFSNAEIGSANFSNTIANGFTESQFASTKNYADGNLQGVILAGNNLSGWNFAEKDLSGAGFENADITNADFASANLSNTTLNGLTFAQFEKTSTYKNDKLGGLNLSNNDLSGWNFAEKNLLGTNFTDSKIAGADLTAVTYYGFDKAQLYATASYKNGDLSNTNLSDNDFSGWSFKKQNLQNADLTLAVLDDTDFSGADLRGASFDKKPDGSPIYKNTIMSDGVIKNFSMASAAESFSIRKYVSSARSSAIFAKISESDATISGGAKLTLDQGAAFEITNGKTLTLASDGQLLINTDSAGSTIFKVDANSGLVFEDGAILTVNIVDDITTRDAFTIALISFEDDSLISGFNNFVKDESLILTINGEKYDGAWDYIVKGSGLYISVNVPEPATYAAVFGAIALAFAAWRRRG
ncbi:pentapeptide repeat-containing protein [Opitutia bacterium KCR 482]|nr:pentapeptide repeat-containing protein [Opitutae bacterium KCR 482]